MKSTYMYGCPKCKSVYSNTSTEPDGTLKCVECDVKLSYLGCTKDEWNGMTEEERDDLKRERIPAAPELPRPDECLPKIAADIHAIKNIAVFFLIISIITAILVFIQFA